MRFLKRKIGQRQLFFLHTVGKGGPCGLGDRCGQCDLGGLGGRPGGLGGPCGQVCQPI